MGEQEGSREGQKNTFVNGCWDEWIDGQMADGMNGWMDDGIGWIK